MSITRRQFGLLNAMGITVWQRRDLPEHSSQSMQASVESTANASTTKNQQVSPNNEVEQQSRSTTEIIDIDLQALLNQQLFNDIIQCLGASRADLSVQNGQVNLGLFNWQFSHSEHIEFSHNILTTPDLHTIASSVELKKMLWQSLGPLS